MKSVKRTWHEFRGAGGGCPRTEEIFISVQRGSVIAGLKLGPLERAIFIRARS